ncbi:hypothetical protein GGI08_004940, partial [Coemansia sp. S2]
MKLYSGNRSAGMLPATVSVAFVLMLHLARSELVPTTASGVDQALATGEEHAYHWWDVFSSNAADLLNNMLSDVGPDKYSISDAAEKAGQAKEGVEYLGIR